MKTEAAINRARESLGGWAYVFDCQTPLQVSSKEGKRVLPNGRTIRDWAPSTPMPFICVFNGVPILRKDWDQKVESGDIVIFQRVPQGGGGGSNPLRIILTLALIVVVNMFAPGLGAVLGPALGTSAAIGTAIVTTAAMVVGGALINALVPTNGGQSGQQSFSQPSPTYNISLQGNTARPGDPIPVLYGYNNIFPNFACQPYSEFIDNDQYYYATFCIGQGDYTPPVVKIDDTALTSFVNAEYQVYAPNQLPTVAIPLIASINVVNAPEVTGQDMYTDKTIGPFTLTEPFAPINKIGIDIIFTKGIYFANDDGSLSSKTVTWVVEARRINNQDVPVNSWQVIGSEVFTANTSTPQRRTYNYTVTVARYQVQVRRTDTRDENNRAAHDAIWAGARAFLDSAPINNSSATFMQVKIKASEQLSGLTQRKINVTCTRKLPIWNGTIWEAPQATRSIAWAFADVLRNQDYGEGRPDNRIDIASLVELDTLYTTRKDYFDGIFDSRSTQMEALRAIARAGRAVPLIRLSVMSIVRDSAQLIPTAMYNNRNIVPGSMTIDYMLFNEESSDGIELEYWDSVKFNWTSTQIPAPGIEDPVKLQKVRLFGITTESHALREGSYIVAADAYRRKVITFRTEMDALIPSYGDMIAISHDVPGWGIGGQVTSWDNTGLIATLSESLTWEAGAIHYIILQTVQGDVIGPYQVTQGGSPFEVVFTTAPSTEPFVGEGKDKTRFIFGPGTRYTQLARLLNVRPRSLSSFEIQAIVEDARVHTADEAYLPGSGSTPGVYRGLYLVADGTANYLSVTQGQRNRGGFLAGSDNEMSNGDPPYSLQ